MSEESNSAIIGIDEVWLPIPGWEEFYEASSFGRIRSKERIARVNSQSSGKRKMGGIIRKSWQNKYGYHFVSLTAQGRRKVYPVHKLVLLAFVGTPLEDQVTRHLNGSPGENDICNLAWGTHLENMQDRKAHGRYAQGENHHAATLTNKQVLEIYQSDDPGVVLAEKYGVWPTKISKIRKGQIYKNVTGGIPKPTNQRYGERCIDKMNFEKATRLRAMKAEGIPAKEIAAYFGISEGTVYDICRGKTWVKRSDD